MNTDDTIVAIASPPGSARRGIVRISGPDAFQVGDAIFRERTDSESKATTTKIVDTMIDRPRWISGVVRLGDAELPAQASLYPAKKSYTGQTSVEIHLLGAPTILGWVVEQCLEAGARQAEPGEFTARAFLAGRLDLSQVHGVAGLIAAQTDSQLRAAERLLHGALSQIALGAREELADLLSLVEGAMDFADEPIEFITVDELRRRLREVEQRLAATQAAGLRAERWESLPRVVLVGRPNAGKSSLFNALIGDERAIATPIAGTTRDSIAARLELNEGACWLVDVAGWATPTDAIDASAQVIADREAADASLRLLAFDLADFESNDILEMATRLTPPVMVVGNKSDIAEVQLGFAETIGTVSCVRSFLAVSAKTGEGMETLRANISTVLRDTDQSDMTNVIALMAEHRRALENAVAAIGRAARIADACDTELEEADLVALEMRTAAEELGQLVGADQTEEMLGRIFSRFCVGK